MDIKLEAKELQIARETVGYLKEKAYRQNGLNQQQYAMFKERADVIQKMIDTCTRPESAKKNAPDIETLHKEFIEKMKPIDPEIVKIVDENFWELLSDSNSEISKKNAPGLVELSDKNYCEALELAEKNYLEATKLPLSRKTFAIIWRTLIKRFGTREP